MYKIITNILFVIVVFFAIWFIAEIVFSFCVKLEKQHNTANYDDISVRSIVQNLDYKEIFGQGFWSKSNKGHLYPTPNKKTRSKVFTKNGQQVYNVEYSIDEFSRRITPEQENNRASRFLLTFGGSIIFGFGVEGNQTLPYYLSQYAKKYRVYNYALPGKGLETSLAMLQNQSLEYAIPYRNGSVLIFASYSHLLFILGSMDTITGYARDFPFLYENDNGDLVFAPNFRTLHPVKNLIFTLLSKSKIIQFLNIDIPRITTKEIDLYVKLIKEIKAVLVKKIVLDDIYIVLLPEYIAAPYKQQIFENLTTALNREGLKFLDVSTISLKDLIGKNPYIPQEFHFTAETNQFLARFLLDKIDLK